MKNLITLFIVLLFCNKNAEAQNIVPNPSFEQYSNCPSALNQLNYCNYWRRGNLSSTDYYHSCSTTTITGVPDNSMGNQLSSANAYTGIIAYSTYSSTVQNYQEYLVTNIPALEVGARYKVTVIVSLADDSRYACSGLGVLFFRDMFLDTVHTNSYINRSPQVDYISYGLVTNAASWTTLVDTFVADSSYTNMVIGNFRADTAIETLDRSSFYTSGAAYYYIDSVAVEKIVPSGITGHLLLSAATVHPNPLKDKGLITFPNSANASCDFTLSDITGRNVIETKEIYDDKVPVDMTMLPAGLYLYQIRSANGLVAIGKLVKE